MGTTSGEIGRPAEVERAFSLLEGLDWTRIDQICEVTHHALALLAQPACLGYLFDRMLADPALLARSERQKLADRVVLYEDPNDTFRLRINRWTGASELPHNHRFPFSARILSGKYLHALYGDVDDILGRESESVLHPNLVRFELPGDVYTLTQQMVHQATSYPDTISLLVRGPAMRDVTVALNPATGRVDSEKVGIANEAPAIHAQTEMNRAQLVDVRNHLARLSLI